MIPAVGPTRAQAPGLQKLPIAEHQALENILAHPTLPKFKSTVQVYIHVYIHICIYRHVYIFVYTCIHMYVCMYVYRTLQQPTIADPKSILQQHLGPLDLQRRRRDTGRSQKIFGASTLPSAAGRRLVPPPCRADRVFIFFAVYVRNMAGLDLLVTCLAGNFGGWGLTLMFSLRAVPIFFEGCSH